MTAHQLAKKLLEGPDLPVVLYGFSVECEFLECDEVRVEEGEPYESSKDKPWGEKHVFIS